MKQKIAIMGAGGIGGYLGCLLQNSGHDVTFIARGKHLLAMQKNGLTLYSPNGDLYLKKVIATDQPEKYGTFDVILFCVKLYDTTTAAKICAPLLNNKTVLLTLQNGIESASLINDQLNHQHILSGAIFLSAYIEAPSIIRHNGGRDLIKFGQDINGTSPQVTIIENLFSSIKVENIFVADVKAMLWEKFTILAANAGIGTLTECDATDMCHDPIMRSLFYAAMLEVTSLAKKMSINIDPHIADVHMNFIDNIPKPRKLIASQLSDKLNNKKMELEWIQGTIHRLGINHNSPTPLHSLAYATLKPYANGKTS